MFKSQDLVQSSFPGNIANIDTPDRAYVALKASCDRQGHYPCNLLQRKQLQSATERYRRYLDDGEKTLFNLGFEEIHFLELKENSTGQHIVPTPSIISFDLFRIPRIHHSKYPFGSKTTAPR